MATVTTNYYVEIPQTIINKVVRVTDDAGNQVSLDETPFAVFYDHAAAMAYYATLNGSSNGS
jgi:hypothetical protein